MWQNLCANINYYKNLFQVLSSVSFVRNLLEQSGSSDLVKIPVRYCPLKVFLSKIMSYTC